MDAEIEGELGLKVLYTPPHGEATLSMMFGWMEFEPDMTLYSDVRCSIVAVHGLGANPQYAWVAKVPANTESTGDSIIRYDPSVNSDIYCQPSRRLLPKQTNDYRCQLANGPYFITHALVQVFLVSLSQPKQTKKDRRLHPSQLADGPVTNRNS